MGGVQSLEVHPKRICTLAEAEAALLKIGALEAELKVPVGAVLKQNTQLGASYPLVPEEDALEGIANPGRVERYVLYFPRSYFEEKKRQLEHSPQTSYDGDRSDPST